jgi:hypothetical protein
MFHKPISSTLIQGIFMDKLPRVDQQGVQDSDKARRDETDNWNARVVKERPRRKPSRPCPASPLGHMS